MADNEKSRRTRETAQNVEGVGGERSRPGEERPERPAQWNKRRRHEREDQWQKNETLRLRHAIRPGPEVENIGRGNIQLKPVERDHRREQQHHEREWRKAERSAPRRQDAEPHPEERS